MEQMTNNFFSEENNVSSDNIEAILEKLKTGVADLFNDENFKDYLDFNSKMYQYSFNNIHLLLKQNPLISQIGSFTFWKSIGRYVKKGEKSLKIIAPITKKVSHSEPATDADKKILKDPDGSPQLVTKNSVVIIGFKVANVFDVSQTDGKPIPEPLHELSGDSPVGHTLVAAVEKVCPIPIAYEDIGSNTKGFYSPTKNCIVIKQGMSIDQTAKTLIHEYTHSFLDRNFDEYLINKSGAEIRAESTAYVVCKHYGLDTSDYSFAYVATWADGKDLNVYNKLFADISDASKKIIVQVDGYIAEQYKILQQQKIDNIKQIIRTAGFKTTNNAVHYMGKLNEVTGKENSIADVKQLLSNPDLSKETKEICNKLQKEFNAQEQSFGKTNVLEP